MYVIYNKKTGSDIDISSTMYPTDEVSGNKIWEYI